MHALALPLEGITMLLLESTSRVALLGRLAGARFSLIRVPFGSTTCTRVSRLQGCSRKALWTRDGSVRGARVAP